ncbi:hypothetical protein WA026_016329 [Henosepilachna vigintioctopunctata]
MIEKFGMLALMTILLVGIWLKYKFTYWQRRGLKVPPFSFYWKHMKAGLMLENAFADRDFNIYQEMKKMGVKHGGIYFVLTPFYVPMDLELIKKMLQNDFNHFVDRGMYMNENDPLSTHLFNLPGNKWKLLRKKLSPTFTPGKMKMMFERLIECTGGMQKVMDKQIGNPVEIKEILSRFTTDIIVSCAFGLNCNSLENPDNEFRTRGRTLFLGKSFLFNLKWGLSFAIPSIYKFFNTKIISEKVTEFFSGVVKDTVTYREKNNISRNDFLQLLIELKNRGQLLDDEKLVTEEISKEENKITLDEIIAQAFLFFDAGLETSATTGTYCLYELSLHEDMQNKVRKEINSVLQRYDGSLTYEALGEMVYLDQVVTETLRKYPPLPSLPRICTKDYKVPGTDLIIKKGIRVVIPVFGIHRDPDYYPDPEKFDPERFSEGNKNDVTYMPFGYGPRYCIGMRFGLLQTKVGLVALLKNYEFKVHPKTKEPLEFDPRIVNMSVKGELWLEHKKCNNSDIVF